ncbi:hypothetical protein PAHAL_8G068000 [Panicum hallii]|uniref:Uncharacterized protein n=1 Tax=Panicum hallii TaxID=206008 RepID=A0A2T8I809_9POAL|nr:hypothetical protein PAHAL_8G068000 [Panicum hallii]
MRSLSCLRSQGRVVSSLASSFLILSLSPFIDAVTTDKYAPNAFDLVLETNSKVKCTHPMS